MKTILKVEVDEQGLSYAHCNLADEQSIKQLIVSFLVLMTKHNGFHQSVISAVKTMQENPELVKQISEASQIHAAEKLFGRKDNTSKN